MSALSPSFGGSMHSIRTHTNLTESKPVLQISGRRTKYYADNYFSVLGILQKKTNVSQLNIDQMQLFLVSVFIIGTISQSKMAELGSINSTNQRIYEFMNFNFRDPNGDA